MLFTLIPFKSNKCIITCPDLDLWPFTLTNSQVCEGLNEQPFQKPFGLKESYFLKWRITMFSSKQHERTKQPKRPDFDLCKRILLFLPLMEHVHFSGAGGGEAAEPALASPRGAEQGHAPCAYTRASEGLFWSPQPQLTTSRAFQAAVSLICNVYI